VQLSSIRSFLALGVSVAWFLAVVGPPPLLSAQDKPQVPSGQQPIRVGTNFVRVDAYPTRNGRIVDGLQAADFEVLEDGVAQKIESFEHIVPTHGPQTARAEPSSQREMAQALASPRNRVFLLFLDGPFVDDVDARAINEPLIKFLSTELADDDLIGVMTPNMSAAQVTFGKKTEVIAENVRTAWWSWGRQNKDLDPELDKRQIQYQLCYPGFNDVPGKMIARSRERNTLESLQDAVKYLASMRDERKAIIAVTQGWKLYREDPDLMRQRQNEAPLGLDKVRVGPTGKLTLEDTKTSFNASSPEVCDRERAYLANIDDDKFLREIIDDANRGNSTFYMIDPGGLRTSRAADRNGALRTLAENTDGLAVLNTNGLDKGFTRIADDMQSYYLLGYYATNTKRDGRFRSLTVKVKQPGIDVRARKGYRAPSEADVTPLPTATAAAPTTASPVQAALDQLGRIRPNSQLRIDAVVGGSEARSLWVVGELRPVTSRPDEFAHGASAAIEAVAGSNSVSGSATLKPGQRTFLTRLELPAAASGALDVRVRVISPDSSLPLAEAVRLDLNALEPKPVMFRRGPSTGVQFLPAGDASFSRTERVRLELPVDAAPGNGTIGVGRVLDRGGTATQIPVTVAERTDEGTGQRWITADVTLAALSPADYVVEVVIATKTGERRMLTPIRVGR
jgi:VWFA-related protein